MEFEVTATESDGELHRMIVTYQPGSDPPPLHFHPAQAETFEILEGRVEFVIDGVRSEHRATATVEVAAGEVHQLRNPGSTPATVRWSTRPALRTGEFFLALHEARESGDVQELLDVLEEFDDVFCLVTVNPSPQVPQTDTVADPRG